MKNKFSLVFLFFFLFCFFISFAYSEQTVDNITFQSTNQSLWGPGSSPNFDINYKIIDEQWDYGEKRGYIVDGMDIADWLGLDGVAETLGFDDDLEDWDFGATVAAGTEGDIEAGLEISLDGGAVNTNLPAQVSLTYPDPNTFAVGNSITISSSCSYPPGGYLNTEPPSFSLYLGGHAGIYAGAAVSVCVFDCRNYGPMVAIPSNYNINGVPLDLTLIHLKNNGVKIDGLDYVGLPYTIPVAVAFATGISGSLDFPEVHTTSHQTGGHLTANGENTYIDLTADLDSYLRKATEIPLGITVKYGEATFSMEALDVDFNVDFTEKRNASFQPTVWALLNFERPVKFQSGDISSQKDLITGNSFTFIFPDKKPLVIQKSFTLENNFHHDTIHKYSTNLSLLAGNFQLTLPDFEIIDECIDLLIDEICIEIDFPGIKIGPFGPIWKKTIGLFTKNIEFFPGLIGPESWQIGGFNKYYGSSFTIDPEDPGVHIRKETSKVINNGGGTRSVIYTLRAQNAGDVPLKEVQIYDTFSDTFPKEWGDYTIDNLHSCELTVNSEFDGTANNDNLLTGTDILDDGYDPNPPPQSNITGGTVIIRTTVAPKPFPPIFVNEAVLESKSWYVGTATGGNSLSEVDLGPGKITKQDDFVLYADQKVILKDTEFVRGHVGSNGTIEVQEGNSGTVAGDLRALSFINIHGHLVSDYAFTNEVVNITGKGALDLSGAIVEHQNQPSYHLPSINFTTKGANITVSASSPITLPPGKYGNVRVLQNAKLTLTSGVYFFNTFQIDEYAKVLLDVKDVTGDQKNDPVSINVVNGLDLKYSASLEIVAGSKGKTRDILINTIQNGDVIINPKAIVRGILTAPNAKVTFKDQSRLEGATYARFISLGKGVNIQYHDDWYGALYKFIDTDCDGNPDYY